MFRLLTGVLLGSAAASAWGQTVQGPKADIIVVGERPTLPRPLRSIAGPDLAAYGAGTIGELLDEVVAESGDRGADSTFLIDGKRVPGLGDVDSYPAEALERIEILPREGGARVGAPAGSRVFNIVLKRETRLFVGRGRVRGATDSGAFGATADGSVTRIRRPQRVNASLLLRTDEALLESERGVVQPAGSPVDLGRFRTLRPETSGAEVSLSAADRLLPWLDGLARLKLSEARSRSLLGLEDDGSGLARTARSRSADLSGQLTAERGSWTFSIDASHRSDSRRVLTSSGAIRDRTTTSMNASGLELLGHGPVLDLGAGPVHLNLGAGIRRDTVRGMGTGAIASRFADTVRTVRADVDVPLLSRSKHALGDVAFRAAVGRGRSSDFGAVSDRSLSLRWSPAEWLQLSAQESRTRTAPTPDLVGEPLLETAGVRYFDPVRNETVDLLTVSGGRVDLPSLRTRTRRLTAELRRTGTVDLVVSAEYLAVRNTNILSVLPPASDLVLQLFPERFLRDQMGRLIRVDLRPVVFPGRREEELRTAFNLVAPLGPGGGSGRLQLSGSVRLLLSSKLQVGSGYQPVDLLDRDAIGLSGAGRPRIETDVSIGYSEKGLGLRVSGERRGRSFLGDANEATVLTFAPITTFSLRGFVEGSRLDAASSLLRNSRLGLTITNLANRRERVRDGRGFTPLAYQPVLRDPVGRSIEVELRKAF